MRERAETEHQEAERLLEELYGLVEEDEAFRDQAMRLRDAVEAHVSFEESELFNVAKSVLDEAEASRIAREVDRFEEDVRAEMEKEAKRTTSPREGGAEAGI